MKAVVGRLDAGCRAGEKVEDALTRTVLHVVDECVEKRRVYEIVPCRFVAEHARAVGSAVGDAHGTAEELVGAGAMPVPSRVVAEHIVVQCAKLAPLLPVIFQGSLDPPRYYAVSARDVVDLAEETSESWARRDGRHREGIAQENMTIASVEREGLCGGLRPSGSFARGGGECRRVADRDPGAASGGPERTRSLFVDVDDWPLASRRLGWRRVCHGGSRRWW